MKSYRSNQVFLFIYWLLLFISGKTLFLFYHAAKTAILSVSEIARIFFYGLRLDMSMAAYLSIFPFLLLFFSVIPDKLTRKLVNGYAVLCTFFIALLQTVDLHLYSIWGYKLDATPLQYLNTPTEMIASSSGAPLFLLFLLFILQLAAGLFLYFRFFQPRFSGHKITRKKALVSFLWLIILVLPLRGGWQQIPINQSDVYFSENAFANHSAINVPWNVFYSIIKKDYDGLNPYTFMAPEIAQKTVSDLYQKPNAPSAKILKTAKSNIIFIILESFTANLVGSVGGEKGVTPEIDKLAEEGYLFRNFYASGDRSEKGLVALLSGYPVQTTTSIIKIPRKTEKLPHLAHSLKKAGYQTSYYYGGELAFANMKSYVLMAGYDKITGKADFPTRDYNSKWGVHDHVLFQRVSKDLKEQKQPFFTTIFTLSSHEPYDVPMKTRFAGDDEANKFRNSMHYTDKAVGNFIEEAKKQPWWQNTLIVLVADHGHTLPNYVDYDSKAKFHIPLILTGGALAKTGITDTTIASQTDLAYSLLNQLHLPNQEFKWSKDIFNPAEKPFAFYIFNDGFGFVTDKGSFGFDNISKQVVQKKGQFTEKDINTGKAYLQTSFEDYLKK
ncbi:sulfatase-like hydrolase/transferase [Adhaeribacter sp. BT258]|uniref:Sulfatase-like hydrolase/transferase n=1 Tax=Adhaeribacter terrigena TaxID=2793070 RepID=A0ABS1C0Q3_9BACT|nr:alkaline phosphatase family protein [Adhaeribacter terrigena]MBK0402984.1 sulfatase-like hydrolase/transferase [Adhaeribacter terrigena]